MQITKQQAQKAWDDEDLKEMFSIQYDSFDDYWEDCEKFNNLPPEQKRIMERTAIDKFKL